MAKFTKDEAELILHALGLEANRDPSYRTETRIRLQAKFMQIREDKS